ncbi:guanylate kinase [Magnetofaba australis]|uniref:Guanylate kinase n=1 Tax=Magnetofaba australis IT-1 TaxID=1434232 RepID=A0A1Y2K082_9PROT|nr:guanylate kinase [Magnetofaba australis]OSM01430.1 putative guanylate kinase [Magnetofaba australis IT-1]
MSQSRRGFALILSAPSGAGKSTLARHLMAADDQVMLSVSTTTRGPRPGEANGVDYWFEAVESFQQAVEQGRFLEWAEVFGNYYGTSADKVLEGLQEGKIVLLDIDWQGAQQVRRNMDQSGAAGDHVSVFIAPPSKTVLHDRLAGRKTDSEEVIAKRMAAAAAEMSHWGEYDYVIINDDLEAAKAELIAIVQAERLKKSRMAPVMDAMMSDFDQ